MYYVSEFRQSACRSDNVVGPVLPAIILRIGVHTGRVLAGVIGNRKPQFNLFGDTVNCAARVTSLGVDGRVHISEATHSFAGTAFEYVSRTVTAKGLGEIQTYLVAPARKRVSRISRNSKDRSVPPKRHVVENDVTAPSQQPNVTF